MAQIKYSSSNYKTFRPIRNIFAFCMFSDVNSNTVFNPSSNLAVLIGRNPLKMLYLASTFMKTLTKFHQEHHFKWVAD